MASPKGPPSKAMPNQDSSDVSPKPRVISGALPPEAAHAPEFVPGEAFQSPISNKRTDNLKADKKTSEASSDQEKDPDKKKRRKRKKDKELTNAEKEAQEKAQKQQAMDEEWWSGDEDFAPGPQIGDVCSDEQD